MTVVDSAFMIQLAVIRHRIVQIDTSSNGAQSSERVQSTRNKNKTLNRVFSYDVTAAVLVFQNKETAAMLLYQAIPPGIKPCFYSKFVFCFSKPICPLVIYRERGWGFYGSAGLTFYPQNRKRGRPCLDHLDQLQQK